MMQSAGTLQADTISIPSLPPRHQALLRDPVATYLASLDQGAIGAVRRSLRRVVKLIDAPSVEAVPWENPRYCYKRTQSPLASRATRSSRLR